MQFSLPPEIQEFLQYTFLGNSVETWLKGIGIFILFLILRFKLVQASIAVIRGLTHKTDTTFDDKIVDVIEHPLRWGILLIGLYFALNVFIIPDTTEVMLSHFLRSIVILLAVWIAHRVITVFSQSLQKLSRHFKSELSESLIRLVISILKAFILIIGAITIFQEWGFNVNGFLASLGLVGMALALAAKDTAANFFGSIMIFTDRPFKIGDWIKTPDVEGTIEEIGMRSTKVRTFAQALVTVPNANLAGKAILNWSRMGKRRIKMNIGLTYSTTSSQMQTILAEIRTLLGEDSDVHPDTIHIYFTDFQDSALGIFCYFFTNTTNWGEYMQVRERLNLEIMRIVEHNGAAFAFPSQSIYVENMEPAAQ
ncbi:MAG: mechanosensitive ion channel family protein [Campylobacterota bacterium]|nr:mechanosensitive ion channel family protein [Campylobacterota bacterium]